MKQIQLACSNGLGSNPFANEMRIALPAGVSPVNSLLDGVTNHPSLTKHVLNPMRNVFSGWQSGSRKIPYQVALAHFNDANNEFLLVVDVATLTETPETEPQPITLEVIESQIRSTLSALRIPIVNKFVEKLAMAIKGSSDSTSENHEDWFDGKDLKIPDLIFGIKDRRIRDCLHNLIEFEPDEFCHMLWELIQTSYFQRLRRINQLGFSEFVYPGATHNRFVHSLGVYFNACRLLKQFRKKLGKDFNEERAKVAITAALLHDIGHGPFSHAFESVAKVLGLKFADHEKVSREIILNSRITQILNEYRKGLADDVAKVVAANSQKDIYASIISSQFDADRLDYLERDQLMTGSQNSQIDLDWIISNIEIRKTTVEIEPGKFEEIETIVFRTQAKLALQTYILGLFNLYNSVYFHPVTRAAEQVFKNLLLRIHKLIQRGDVEKVGLPLNNPIISFFQNQVSFESMLDLDDCVIWDALRDLRQSEDQLVSKLAIMLKDRRLPKAINVRERVKEYFQADEFNELTKKKRNEKIDSCVDQFEERLDDYILKYNLDEQVWFDSGSRVAYKSISKERGKLDTIQVLENSKVFGLEQLSDAVEVVKKFKFERVYLPFENPEISDYLNSLITTCCKEESQNGM